MKRFKWTFTFTVTEMHFISAFIILMHIFILKLPDDIFYTSHVAEAMTEKEVEKEKELSPEQRLEMALGKKMRFIGVTYLGQVDRIYHSKLSDLLKSKIEKTQTLSTSLSGLARYKEDFHGQDFGNANTGELIELNADEKIKLARRIIGSRKAQIKGCYSHYQKIDELLEGHASLTLKPLDYSNKIKVNFKGIGQKSVIAQLNSCISDKLSTLSFPAQLKNVDYKMIFNFQ